MRRGYQKAFYLHSEAVRDPLSRKRQAEKIAWVLQTLAYLDIERVTCVDIGCSSGIIVSMLAPKFDRVVGLDYDIIALRTISPEIRRSVLFIHGDAMTLPFADNSCAVVICAQVYEHVPNAQTLFDELYRILHPEGVIFFSGPNWLFPIEPHYFLPFLHWLPERLASGYLRLTGKGPHYYERSYSYWKLHRMLGNFYIQDVTLDVLRYQGQRRQGLCCLLKGIPSIFLKWLLPAFPNFNWLLYKSSRVTTYPPAMRETG